MIVDKVDEFTFSQSDVIISLWESFIMTKKIIHDGVIVES